MNSACESRSATFSVLNILNIFNLKSAEQKRILSLGRKNILIKKECTIEI